MSLRIIAPVCLIFLSCEFCLAEDVNAVLGRVNGYVQVKNYSKALDELAWARKEIEKLHFDRIKGFFPDQMAGFIGQKVETNSVIGFTNFERTYAKGELTVRLSLTGGGSGAAGLGNLAALGRMAAMMGGQGPGQETLRVGTRTATLMTQPDTSAELTVFLDSGSVLKLDLENGSDGELLKTMAGAIKLDDLDAYLKGS